MAVRIESNAEPLPGYRLMERLGGGGFGEVWKCEAPGGLFKAIKFVYGDLDASDEEGARADQELKALSRVKTVRHAYILSMDRVDILDGQLMIVSELADRTVWDRFRECRSEGLPGIPRGELLDYMAEAAEALDFMYGSYQLQHLDIKPQNLFLVHSHIKVADFGLVKDLDEKGMASVTGGVTPVYAAPETFDGKVTEYSDQYSLAIVYQELLTGQRPFTGTSLRQLVMQHIYNQPDLDSLPVADRAVVGRALAKEPAQRYPHCRDFIQALRAAEDRKAKSELRGPATETANAPTAAELQTDQPDIEKTHGGPKHREATARARDSVPVLEVADPAAPATTTPSPARHSSTPPPPERMKEEDGRKNPKGLIPPAAIRPQPSKEGLDAPTIAGKPDGVLLPALVIGLGSLGLGVLRQLRRQIAEEQGSPDALPQLRLLYVDTDPETARAAGQGRPEIALRPSEILLARLHRPSYYLKPSSGSPGLESWLPQRMLYRMPRQQTPSGFRALGRLAFVDNYRTISRRLETELRDCCQPEALQQAALQTGLPLRSSVPRVYIVAGLAGGSGAGMFLDMAYTARQLLRDLGHDAPEVVGLFLLPHAGNGARIPELGNAFAALTELNHYGTPGSRFEARYDSAEAGGAQRRVSDTDAPFRRCALFALPEARGHYRGAEGSPSGVPHGSASGGGEGGLCLTEATERVLSQAGRFLFADLATPLGRAAEQARRHAAEGSGNRGQGTEERGRSAVPATIYHAPGMFRILWPRRLLLDQSGGALCRRLVQRWMTKDAKPLREVLRPWVRQQWEEQGLSQDQVIARFQEGCERALKQTPENALAAAMAPVLTPPAGGRAAHPNPLKVAVVFEVMERLDELLGVPEECRKGAMQAPPPSAIEQALADASAALGEEYGHKLAVLIVKLIEDPQYRLAGAEEIIRQLNEQVDQALRHQEELARELQQRAAVAYQRILTLLEGPDTPSPATPVWKAAFTRRSPGPPALQTAELLDLLRAYPKWRYQSQVLQRVSALYVSLRGQLSDQLREVDFCRARLGELAGMLATEPETGVGGGPAAGRHLLPEGCKSLADAVRHLDEGVGAAELLDFDRRVQALLRTQFRALVHVCTTSANVLRVLAPAMRQEARAFLEPRLAAADVAQVYLEQHQARESPDGSASDVLRQDLLGAYRQATPSLQLQDAAEVFLMSVPAGPAGGELRDLTRHAVGAAPAGDAPATDEIVFYREYANLSLRELEQFGPAAQQAYQKMLAQDNFTPHSRTDVVEWRPQGVTVASGEHGR